MLLPLVSVAALMSVAVILISPVPALIIARLMVSVSVTEISPPPIEVSADRVVTVVLICLVGVPMSPFTAERFNVPALTEDELLIISPAPVVIATLPAPASIPANPIFPEALIATSPPAVCRALPVFIVALPLPLLSASAVRVIPPVPWVATVIPASIIILFSASATRLLSALSVKSSEKVMLLVAWRVISAFAATRVAALIVQSVHVLLSEKLSTSVIATPDGSLGESTTILVGSSSN